jgi:GT2 family glycosyltransferase
MSKENPFVSIVTVNYNGKKYLKSLFDSLFELNYPQKKLEIIMVDNGSSDGSLEFVNENFPRVKIIKNDINNYCRANNLGIKNAKGKFIALINTDIRVDKCWLIELIKVIGHDDSIGIATSKVLFLNGKIQSTGHYELPDFYWSDRGFGEIDEGQYSKTEEVLGVSHCAALYRKECLNDIGLLDEDFNMYLEDVDMSIRAKQKGWSLFYVPQSIAYHNFHGSADEELVVFYCERNRLLLLAKHYPHKLSDLLFGKGYFTIQNKRNDLIKILPDIFIKLIKHHDNNTVASLFSSIFESLNKILNLEKAYLIKQLQHREEEISGLNTEIYNFNTEIYNLNTEMTRLHTEISRLNNVISQIYNSQTYRFIAHPIWRILEFFKKKPNFNHKEISGSCKYRKDLCFAYFSAHSKVAKYKGSNSYNLKITNDTLENQLVKIKIEIDNNNTLYAYLVKSLIVQPKSSIEVIIDYNWRESAIFCTNGQSLKFDEIWRKDHVSSGFHRLNAILFDNKDLKIDRLSIFQKLEL